MNQALFWGDFDLEIYEEKHAQIRYFLSDDKLHRHLESLKKVQEQSDFFKVACDQFLRLVLRWSVARSNDWLKIPKKQYKTFSRRLKRHQHQEKCTDLSPTFSRKPQLCEVWQLLFRFDS